MKPRPGVSTIVDFQRRATGLVCKVCKLPFMPTTPQQTLTCGSSKCKAEHDREWRKAYRAKVKRRK